MNEKETKPPVTTVTRKVVGEEEQEQPVTVGNIAIIAMIMVPSVPTLLLIGHALPLLDNFFNGMKPLVSYIGFFTGLALFVLLALCVWYVHDRFRVDIKRRTIEAGKFQVDPQSGNYDAYFVDTNGRFLVPNPGVTVPPVPQTYAPQLHFINKGSMSKGDEKSNQPLLEQGNVQKPSVDELASKVERNSLQVNVGRSLTTGKDLVAELNGTHTKIIGGTQMGKSCMAGSILAQIEKTHDPDRLQFALLDLEYKTSRLFEKSSHLARVTTGQGREVRLHAKSIDEVPTHLHHLTCELERRDRLSYEELEELPHILIYIEEFLNLKKQLKNSDKRTCEQFLTDFNTLTTRGLKLGLHVVACAQVDYADDDLKDAMAQFIGLNLAFGVKPSAAMAAGFISSDLLSQNFASKIPGQFVLETLGGSDLGIAPDYDVKKKLNALSQTKILGMRETRDLSLESNWQEGRNQIEPALQAIVADLDGEQWIIEQFNWKLDQLKALLHAKQDEQFKQIWEVSPGSGREYKKAKAERVALIEHMKSLLGKVA